MNSVAAAGHTGSGPKKPPVSVPVSPQFHPYSLVRSIWKHKFAAVFVWAAVTALTVVVVLQLPRTYEAEATVLVGNTMLSKDIVPTTVSTDSSDRLEQIRQKVLSHNYLMDLMRTYGLHEGDRKSMPAARVVEIMRDEINMRLDRGWGPGQPNTFRVAIQGKDPEATMKVANHLARFFVDDNRRRREGQANAASEFFDTRMADAKREVELNEARLNRFKTAYAGELPQQQEALLATQSQARTQLQGVQDAQSRAAQTRLLLNNSLELARTAEASAKRLMDQAAAARKRSPAPVAVASNAPGLTDAQRLEAELNQLRQRYGELHPDVRRARTRLDEAKAREALDPHPAAPPPAKAEDPNELPLALALEGPERDLRQTYNEQHERVETIKAQIQVADQDEAKLATERQRIIDEISAIDERLAKLPMREQEMASVLRDYEMGKENYQSMVDKKLAADLSLELEQHKGASETFEILDPARLPEEPVKPKRSLLAMIGSLMGMVLGLGVAVALEMKKQVLLGEWELPPGTPVLGRVVELPTGKSPGLLGRRKPRKRVLSA
jgi:polysaccharide chain length determinant protein (PEP-CTERM system associated)